MSNVLLRCKPCALGLIIALSGSFACAAGAPTADVSRAQARGAEEFLAALAGGSPQAIALAYHPTELDGLRARLLERLRADAARNDGTTRARLFGAGKSLADLERMTGATLYGELAKRLEQRGRAFQDVKWLASIPDGESVHVMGLGKPPKERGQVMVLTTVTLLPYGKEWRAAIPSEIHAQIDDLIEGRGPSRAAAAPRLAGPTPPTPAAAAATDAAIVELLASAEKTLIAGNCADYYDRHMSPNFRRATSSAAMKTLVATCNRSIGTRETLIAAIRIVRDLAPRYELEGARAVYDVSGQGLPFDRYVLERLDKRWYIAE